MVAQIALPLLGAQDDPMIEAEAAILALVGVLLGDGRKDLGLMARTIRGVRHVESCQIGMYIRDGDSLRGGQPCSARCADARAALSLAAGWLRAREGTR